MHTGGLKKKKIPHGLRADHLIWRLQSEHQQQEKDEGREHEGGGDKPSCSGSTE